MDGKNSEIRDLVIRVKDVATMDDVLKKRGYPTTRNRRIPCPIHNGKNPNFSYDDKIYFCFKCHAKGSVIDFVMWSDNLSFSEAVETLAKEYGLYGMALSTSKGESLANKRLMKKAREQAYEKMRNCLIEDLYLSVSVSRMALEKGPPWTESEETAIKKQSECEYTACYLKSLDIDEWKRFALSEDCDRITQLCSVILGDRDKTKAMIEKWKELCRTRIPEFVPMIPADNPYNDPEAGMYSAKGWLNRRKAEAHEV